MGSRIKVVRIYSCYADGLARVPTEIEISLSPGLPTFDVIGLCDSTIRESRGRIRAALISSGFVMPKGHITVSISPAYLHKGGSAFDLPTALGILCVSGQISTDPNKKIYAEGELGLTGELKGTPGAALRLRETSGFDIAIAPSAEKMSAACAKFSGMLFDTLADAVDSINSGSYSPIDHELSTDDYLTDSNEYPDISCIKGQSKAMRALLIAAAGRHNIVILGSPGCGKTMAGQVIRGLMPQLAPKEASELYTIYEGIGSSDELITGERPFRYIHPGISLSGLIGSAGSLKPGELSLAHNGIVFADELCEFKPDILDAMRIPLEKHAVSFAKDGKRYEFPASFMFVGAGNPCRCGMFYENKVRCKCTPLVRDRYLNKISGPFADRIDIFTEMRTISGEDLKSITSVSDEDLSRAYREQVSAAWAMQQERYKNAAGTFNGSSDSTDAELMRADKGVIEYASEIAEKLTSSPRGFGKLIRVGRTIADLDGRADMRKSDIAEASVYRKR